MLITSTGGRGHLDRVMGFTLIEVLVTLVVLSIALLGLAGLQTASLRDNQSAMNRSQAVALAYDILDRIRANRTAAMSNAYNIDFGESAPHDSSAIADHDLASWKASLARLPDGDGAITTRVETSGNILFTVSVQWFEHLDHDDDKDGSDHIQTITVSTQS